MTSAVDREDEPIGRARANTGPQRWLRQLWQADSVFLLVGADQLRALKYVALHGLEVQVLRGLAQIRPLAIQGVEDMEIASKSPFSATASGYIRIWPTKIQTSSRETTDWPMRPNAASVST